MPLITSVRRTTVLADVDEVLRDLLEVELRTAGFSGLDIAFEAPTRDWSAQLVAPTVDLFLYELRESDDLREPQWETEVTPEGVHDVRPPIVLDATYAVTAWTQDVQDEHRILSQVVAILHAFPIVSDAVADGGWPGRPLRGRVAQRRNASAPEFWNAIGGQFKVSIDYTVTVHLESGTTRSRGPEVLRRALTLARRDVRTGEDVHRLGGRVVGADGTAVPDALVCVPETGTWTETDREGCFRDLPVPPGPFALRVRAADGREVALPASERHPAELVMPAARKRSRS